MRFLSQYILQIVRGKMETTVIIFALKGKALLF